MDQFIRPNVAYLTVWSESRPLSELSTLLGMSPDRGWTVGDVHAIGEREARRNETSWQVFSPTDSPTPVREQLDALFERVETPLSRMVGSVMGLDCRLQIVQSLTLGQSELNGVDISAAWIKALASIGGTVDIDQYVLPESAWLEVHANAGQDVSGLAGGADVISLGD